MTRFSNWSLVIGAAGLMVALSVGSATAEQPALPNPDAMPGAPNAIHVPCGKRADVVRLLRENFGEGPIAQGLAHTGAVAEVFISSQGNWTIVATSPDGVSCMIGAGRAWQPAVAHDDTI
jgi:hypothetical protein